MKTYLSLFSIHLVMLSLSSIAMDNPQDGNNQGVASALKQIQKALQAETKDLVGMQVHRGNSPEPLRILALRRCEPILKKALETDNISLLSQFFRLNIDSDYRLPNSATGPMPLVILAIKMGSVKCLKFLIAKSADLESTYFFDTPLIIAAQEGHLECLKALVRAHVNLNAQNDHCCGGETAMHTAVNKGHYECARLLVEAGADASIEAYCGKTPLMKCIPQWDSYEKEKIKLQCLKLLIRYGVDLDQKDSFGNTAIMLAAERGKAEFLELSLKAGARWDLTNEKGYTALELVPNKDYSWYEDCRKMLQDIQQRHPAINFLWKLI